jgi:hypothetical protein
LITILVLKVPIDYIDDVFCLVTNAKTVNKAAVFGRRIYEVRESKLLDSSETLKLRAANDSLFELADREHPIQWIGNDFSILKLLGEFAFGFWFGWHFCIS